MNKMFIGSSGDEGTFRFLARRATDGRLAAAREAHSSFVVVSAFDCNIPATRRDANAKRRRTRAYCITARARRPPTLSSSLASLRLSPKSSLSRLRSSVQPRGAAVGLSIHAARRSLGRLRRRLRLTKRLVHDGELRERDAGEVRSPRAELRHLLRLTLEDARDFLRLPVHGDDHRGRVLVPDRGGDGDGVVADDACDGRKGWARGDGP